MNNIQLLSLNDIPFIKPNDNLIEIILDNLKNNNEIIEDNDVIVIAQKIISKSENRYVDIDNIKVSDKAKKLSEKLKKHPGLIQCVLNESKKIISII